MICVAIEDFLEHPAVKHVISHFRHKSLATYDRARIIRKPDNPHTDNRECGVVIKVSTCILVRSPQSFQENYESPQNSRSQEVDNNKTHTADPLCKASFNPLNPELNPICYLLALLGAHHFLHVSRIRVKSLTLR